MRAKGVHYVPVRQDYSDLFNIMAFFDGDLSPQRRGHHDGLAREIAESGRQWAETYWREVDAQACKSFYAHPSGTEIHILAFLDLFRLLLEYARVLETERTAFTPYEGIGQFY